PTTASTSPAAIPASQCRRNRTRFSGICMLGIRSTGPHAGRPIPSQMRITRNCVCIDGHGNPRTGRRKRCQWWGRAPGAAKRATMGWRGFTMGILIIEDDAAIADAIVAALTRAGHAVDRLAGGRQADAALQAHPYDLVVLDLGLPEMDGVELLRRLRART